MTDLEITDKMPAPIFVRHYMDMLKFENGNGGYDWRRAAKFWGIRYEFLLSAAAGDTPLLKRERDMIRKRSEIEKGAGLVKKNDARTISDLQNAQLGRYLRTLRERMKMVNVEGVSKNQAQIAATMEISIGAVQAWEYGRTRIPNIRLEQYLKIVGADDVQATKAWVMLGEMPLPIQLALGEENPEFMEAWYKTMEIAQNLHTGRITKEITPPEAPKPTFVSHKQEVAHLKAQGATPEQIKEATQAPKPRKENPCRS